MSVQALVIRFREEQENSHNERNFFINFMLRWTFERPLSCQIWVLWIKIFLQLQTVSYDVLSICPPKKINLLYIEHSLKKQNNVPLGKSHSLYFMSINNFLVLFWISLVLLGQATGTFWPAACVGSWGVHVVAFGNALPSHRELQLGLWSPVMGGCRGAAPA